MSNPYYIKGTNVLINKLGITDASVLKATEQLITSIRMGMLKTSPIKGDLDYKHLKDIHKFIFDDLYDWAGKARYVTTSKNGNVFLHAGRIEPSAIKLLSELKNDNHLKDLSRPKFIEKVAHYYSELNFIHPFPEGNGRSQRVFFSAIAKNAEYNFDWSKADNNEVVIAATHSQSVDNSKLEVLFNKISSFSTKPDIGIAEQQKEYHSAKAAEAIIKNTADKELANQLKPLREKESTIIEDIRSLKEIVSDSDSRTKDVLIERLAELQKTLKVFRKERPSVERALRAESKRYARNKHPQEAKKIEIRKKQESAKRANKGNSNDRGRGR